MRIENSSETAGTRHWRSLALAALLTAAVPAARLAADPAGGGSVRPHGNAGEGGMRVRREPATGRSVPPPALDAHRERASGSGAAPSDDLVEVPGPSHAGGAMVHLKRRLLAGMTTRRERDGSVETGCRALAPESVPAE
jgi:hypothetical protein